MGNKLPLEQQTKDETDLLKTSWSASPHTFLLQRSQEKYHLKANQRRRVEIEGQLDITLPELTDEMLVALYKESCRKYFDRSRQKYSGATVFTKTPSERNFAHTLTTIIKDHKKLRHIEIYPNHSSTDELPAGFKMVVGNYVPDFLIFGLKIRGASAVAIEIDGDSHIEKWCKDALRNVHLKQLKIFTFEVPNEQATDIAFLSKAFLEMYRLRNGSFNDQIKRVKRAIWVKTISCQLSLEEIEQFVQEQFSIELNLKQEAAALLNLETCPRVTKRELSKSRS